MKKKHPIPATQLTHPRCHSEIIGQDKHEQTVLNSFYSGRMPHAWLITGPKGIGKATFAYRIAKFLCVKNSHSEHATTLAVAGHLPIVKRIMQGSCADIFVLEAESAAITVEQVREISHFLHLTPAESASRIVIIDSADALNTNAANALLKLLEEPPANSFLFLISHKPAEILPTLRSRCRMLTLSPLQNEAAVQVVTMHCNNVPREDAERLLVLSEGSPGTAITFLHHNILDYYKELLQLLNTLPSLDMQSAFTFVESHAAKNSGLSFEHFTYLLNRFLICLVKKSAGLSIDMVLPEEEALITRLSLQSTLDKLLGLWEKISSFLDETIKANLDQKQVTLVALDTVRTGLA